MTLTVMTRKQVSHIKLSKKYPVFLLEAILNEKLFLSALQRKSSNSQVTYTMSYAADLQGQMYVYMLNINEAYTLQGHRKSQLRLNFWARNFPILQQDC